MRASPHETRCERGCEVRRRRARDSTEHDGRRPRRKMVRVARCRSAARDKHLRDVQVVLPIEHHRRVRFATHRRSHGADAARVDTRPHRGACCFDRLQQRNRAHAILERRASGRMGHARIESDEARRRARDAPERRGSRARRHRAMDEGASGDAPRAAVTSRRTVWALPRRVPHGPTRRRAPRADVRSRDRRRRRLVSRRSSAAPSRAPGRGDDDDRQAEDEERKAQRSASSARARVAHVVAKRWMVCAIRTRAHRSRSDLPRRRRKGRPNGSGREHPATRSHHSGSCRSDFTTPDGVRIPFTFHATRAARLPFPRRRRRASVDAIKMLAGHAGESVTKPPLHGTKPRQTDSPR